MALFACDFDKNNTSTDTAIADTADEQQDTAEEVLPNLDGNLYLRFSADACAEPLLLDEEPLPVSANGKYDTNAMTIVKIPTTKDLRVLLISFIYSKRDLLATKINKPKLETNAKKKYSIANSDI